MTIPEAPNPFPPSGCPDAFPEQNRPSSAIYEDFAETAVPSKGRLSEEKRRRLKHGYFASVSFVDAQVGRLLGFLERLGLADRTIVVFWGDNGWKLGDHGSWSKMTNFENDTRCPLIIRAPGREGNGRSSEGLVELLDVYPTLCQLAGLPRPAHLEGQTLAPLLDDPAVAGRDAAFSQIYRLIRDRHVMSYAMRTERHRFIEWRDWETGVIVAEELYDHTDDPDENVNLAPRAETSDLRDRLRARLRQTCPIQNRPGPALLRARSSETAVVLELVNELGEEASVYELDASGSRGEVKILKAGERLSIRTFLTHPFVVESRSGDFYKVVFPGPKRGEFVLRKPPVR